MSIKKSPSEVAFPQAFDDNHDDSSLKNTNTATNNDDTDTSFDIDEAALDEELQAQTPPPQQSPSPQNSQPKPQKSGGIFHKLFSQAQKTPPKLTPEQELNRALQQKLIKQSVEKKSVNKKEKIEKEEYLQKAAVIFQKKIIPNFDKLRNHEETHKMWTKFGLPPKLRGQLWQLAVGNALHVNRDLYAILRTKKALDIDQSGDPLEIKDNDNTIRYNRETTISLIKLDLSRTFPHLHIFQEGGPFYDSFKEVLECYVKYRPDVGYVQGMSFIVAMLLLNMESYNAFVCLANMLNVNHFYSFFRMNAAEIEKQVFIVKYLLKELCPKLHAHFVKCKIDMASFMLDWYITLFSKSIPLDLAAIIWDLYFLEGEVLLYKATLGIFKYFEHKLLKLDFELITQFLTHLGQFLNPSQQQLVQSKDNGMMIVLAEDVDEQKFVNSIRHMKVTPQLLEKAKEEAVLHIKQMQAKGFDFGSD